MRKIFNILLMLCILGILVGLSGLGDETVTGFSLAIGAVMYVLAFITLMIEKAETTR